MGKSYELNAGTGCAVIPGHTAMCSMHAVTMAEENAEDAGMPYERAREVAPAWAEEWLSDGMVTCRCDPLA